MNARLPSALLLAALIWPIGAHAALHLMFPYDYLSLTEAERRHYVLGVLDARLAPLAPLPPRRPGLLSGKVEDSFFDPLPEDELEAWER